MRKAVDVDGPRDRGIGSRVPFAKSRHYRSRHVEEVVVQKVLCDIECRVWDIKGCFLNSVFRRVLSMIVPLMAKQH